MREFASTNYRLSKAPKWQKILYTSFLLFMLIGIGSSIAIGVMRTGITPNAIVDYYIGNPDKFMFERTAQEMLDVTHMHAFMFPMILLVLGHMFLLSSWKASRKRRLITAAIIVMLSDLISPWMVRFLHPYWAYVKWAGIIGMVPVFLFMIGVPLSEMWGRPGKEMKY